MTKIEIARIPDLHTKLVLIDGVLHQAFVCIFDDDSQSKVYEAVAEREAVSDNESEPEIRSAVEIAEVTSEAAHEVTPEASHEVTTEAAHEVTPEAAHEVTTEDALEVTPEATPSDVIS